MSELENPGNAHIIIVDDDIEIQSLLQKFFSSKGYKTSTYGLASEALKAIENEGGNGTNGSGQIEIVISDVKMPEMSGLEFVQRLKRVRQDIPVVLVSAFGGIRTAVKAIQHGAQDYILKPFKLPQLIESVERAIKYLQAKQELSAQRQLENPPILSDLVGTSQSMLSVYDLIRRVAQTTTNVLITGETGTGKELVAQAIHRNGPRANKPFIAINCSAIPESLLESELFGHAKGSFTGATEYRRGLFQEAEGGTLFLDEIGDMNTNLQTKLLRVLQERKVKPIGTNAYKNIDVRIIAATHRDLRKEVKEGRFREDLFYRLNVVQISLPPLRKRREDIPLLAEHFLQKFSELHGSKVTGFTPEAIRRLIELPWSGNVRELCNTIEKAVILANDILIEEELIATSDEPNDVEHFFEANAPELPTLSEFENRYIKFILKKTQGQKEKAAKILGIDRKTLYRKEQNELRESRREIDLHDAEVDNVEAI